MDFIDFIDDDFDDNAGGSAGVIRSVACDPGCPARGSELRLTLQLHAHGIGGGRRYVGVQYPE